MNFFDAQDQARRASKWLVVVYVVATLLIVAGVTLIVGIASGAFSAEAGYEADDYTGLLLTTAVVTTLVIFGASLYKTSALSAGGGKVATSLGGTLVPADVSDPLRRQLRNVVEEMSIAAGVPVPEIYVLEEEGGINAFAAGFNPADAAVAVTRGTLELLTRDELQGVIAHEFSHILNGDMRLNVRMMGVLFGIMVVSLIGRLIMRGGFHASIVSSRRSSNSGGIVLVGVGLTLLGFVGMFFARIIKAAVSRQREFLADASAVQFTRQSAGIANALKKIGGFSQASYLTSTDPEEVSHMLFGAGSKLFGLFATHPPLTDRIKALDPSFTASDYPSVDAMAEQVQQNITSAAAGFSGDLTASSAASSAEITAAVGRPEADHIEYAKKLRLSIPAVLYDAAHSAELAFLLTLALVLDRDGQHLKRQLLLIEERMGEGRTRLITEYQRELENIDERFRLPLLEISFPALKLRPAPQLTFLIELASRLVQVDDQIDLYEYSVYRILMVNLGRSIDPTGARNKARAGKKELRQATVNLLAIVADYGHDDPAVCQQAFDVGAEFLGKWATGIEIQARRDYTVDILDHSLDVLLKLSGKGRRRLLRAICEVAGFDNHLTIAEAELIRVICATLDCPMPPILMQELAYH